MQRNFETARGPCPSAPATTTRTGTATEKCRFLNRTPPPPHDVGSPRLPRSQFSARAWDPDAALHAEAFRPLTPRLPACTDGRGHEPKSPPTLATRAGHDSHAAHAPPPPPHRKNAPHRFYQLSFEQNLSNLVTLRPPQTHPCPCCFCCSIALTVAGLDLRTQMLPTREGTGRAHVHCERERPLLAGGR